MTQHQQNNFPRMHLGLGLLIGLVTGIAVQNVAIGIAIGLVFACTLHND